MIFTRFFPNFAVLASLRRRSGHALREIFRTLVALGASWREHIQAQ